MCARQGNKWKSPSCMELASLGGGKRSGRHKSRSGVLSAKDHEWGMKWERAAIKTSVQGEPAMRRQRLWRCYPCCSQERRRGRGSDGSRQVSSEGAGVCS